MRIGILGSGLMGGKLGTIFARAGHEVVFSYSHTKGKLEKLARDAGAHARAGTPAEAAKDADALLLAVHWSRVDDILNKAGDLSGKVIVTCSLPMNENDTSLVIANTSSGSEELAKKVPKAHIVSAFNTVPSEVLFAVFERAGRKGGAGSGIRPSVSTAGQCAREESPPTDHRVGFEPIDAVPSESRATRAVHVLVGQLAYEEIADQRWRIASSVQARSRRGDYAFTLHRAARS